MAQAKASDNQAVIARQHLPISKLTRQLYGQRSERTVRLLDQMELTLEALESSATQDEIAAERTVAKTTNVWLHPQASCAPALPRASAA